MIEAKVTISDPSSRYLSLSSFTTMPELIVCTGKYALLPTSEQPTAATIVIDQASGKITHVLEGYTSRTDFEVSYPESAHRVVSWIDAGDQIILPGLVESVHIVS